MTLAEVARGAIEAQLRGETFAAPAGGDTAAVFVTVRGPDGVHGSVGTTEPDAPLPQLVARLAILAALDDPRQVPMTADELERAEIVVTVLGAPRPVQGPGDLDPEHEAISIRMGVQSATLLPLATQGRGWDARTVLAVLCHKAGLPRAAWEAPGARVEARRVLEGV
jgi:uncharacterized protein (TIGR00296 family)